MTSTVLRKQNEWVFYWIVTSDDGRLLAQSTNTYPTKAEALTMARGNVRVGDEVVDDTGTLTPRPSQSGIVALDTVDAAIQPTHS